MYNDIRNFPIPEEATVVGYADYIALIVVAEDLKDTKLYSCKTISIVKAWQENSGLTLIKKKMQMVLITKHRKINYDHIRILVQDHQVLGSDNRHQTQF